MKEVSHRMFVKIGVFCGLVFVMSIFVLANMPTDVLVSRIFHVIYAISGIATFIFLIFLGLLPVAVTFSFEHAPSGYHEYIRDSEIFSQLVIQRRK